MWPNKRFGLNAINPNAGQSSQQTSNPLNKTISSVDSNQLLMAANSLRTLFGDDISQTLLNTINSTANRSDSGLGSVGGQRTAETPPQRPPHRVIDYESPHFSRLDRNLLNQMSANTQNTDNSRNETNSFYDPNKMPQKSILKKNTNQSSFETTNYPVIDIEDEDCYLYGSSSSAPVVSKNLPPGIVDRTQSNRTQENSADGERPLSPISLRLKREMDNMDRNRRMPEPPKENNFWTPIFGLPKETGEPMAQRNDISAEQTNYRRYHQVMNPSSVPEDDLELEKLRIQQIAAIEAGILKSNPPKNHSTSHRLSSPESSPKRMRRRSPSRSPRRRSISPRRRSVSPRRRRRRSSSPRRGSRRSRSRSDSRGRRRLRSPEDRSRRRRTRSPSRSPNRMDTHQNIANEMHSMIKPMPGMIPLQTPGFIRPPHLMGLPLGPMMDNFMAVYPPIINQNIPHNILPKQQPQRSSVLTNVPLVSANPKPPPNKSVRREPKKEHKLLNPTDLLIAEKTKLREEMKTLKKEYDRKLEEQNRVVVKDGGTDSYAYRQLDKMLKEMRDSMESCHQKMTKNFQLINEIQKSKSKAKQFLEKLKVTGDISKVELPKSPKISEAIPLKKATTDWPTNAELNRIELNRKKVEEKSETKKDEKTTEEEEEEDELNCRFHYFDSGPHWCKCCNTFLDNMRQYFAHIHTKDHLNRSKESDRTPWITKDYIRDLEKQKSTNKNQMVVASKGIQFMHPTQAFYCELCKQFMNDSYQAEKHFKTAKHNRSYTRFTLLHAGYEGKWKSERDKSFTEFKKKERDLEKEKSKKEFEKKSEDRKRLEEEVKRKDKAVKERIEAMNKSLKIVNELDETKATAEKKDDKTSPSPKSIRLNLNTSSESKNKSKESEKTNDKSNEKSKSSEKSDKSRNSDKSKDKSDNKETKTKDSMDKQNSEDIDDMLVIDEINCDSREDIGVQDMELIDENKLLNEENTTEAVDSKQIIENNDISVGNDQNSEEVEGVMPSVELKDETKGEGSDKQVSEQTPEVRDQNKTDNSSKEVPTVESIEEKTIKSSDDCVNTRDNSEDISVKLDPKPQELDDKQTDVKTVDDNTKSGSIEANTSDDKNGVNSVAKNESKVSNILDIDEDIAKLNKRFDAMVKKEDNPMDAEYEDELEGFDVIDSINDENNGENFIELSSD